MITFDDNGLHFDVDLTQDDFDALQKYVLAVRADERLHIVKAIASTLQPKPVEEVAEEPTEEPAAE